MDWILFHAETLNVRADTTGVIITRREVARPSNSSRLERVMPALLLQLEDMEIGAAQNDSSWLIPYPQFVNLEAKGIDAFENLCQWSPLTLEIESSQWLGSPDFRYTYRFHKGTSPVSFERRGCFLTTNGEVFRLDSDSFTLLEAIDSFNASPATTKADSALLRFHEIKGLASSIGAKLDKYLGAERVLLPSKLGVDIVPEAGGRISFVPKIEGVPQESLTRAFFAGDDIESVYAVDDEAGGRIRVIFDDEQQEVLRRIQKVRHLSGRSKSEVMRDPLAVFDGVSGSVEFSFGPRVVGVGDFPFTVRPYLDSRAGIFDGLAPAGHRPPDYGLECTYADGTTERVQFSSQKQILQFKNEVSDARCRGIGTIDFDGRTILVTPELESSLEQLLKIGQSKHSHPPDTKSTGQYVLIYTNETELEYQGKDTIADVHFKAELPTGFKANAKAHQSTGYQWLRANYERNRTGCLLADDMGLGKTLQVLLFLAALIEEDDLSDNKPASNLPPWNP
ncbi:MAG: hypothetical protein C5B54_09275, partial [Acidobacteria bacterium]